MVSYEVKDAQGATVAQTETITIHGTNDTPTVTAALTDTANEGDLSFTHNLLDGASDKDDGETATLSVVNVSYTVDGGASSPTAPTGVTLAGSTLTVDPTSTAFDHLAVGATQTIVVSYEVKDARARRSAQPNHHHPRLNDTRRLRRRYDEYGDEGDLRSRTTS